MLGIVTHTKDRSEFVIRLLYYYASVNCPYTIYIGDSSGEEHIQKTETVIDKLKGRVNVVYKLYPKKDGPTTLNELLDIIIEEYVAFIGDDDYLVPKSLAMGVSFLKTHPEYSTVQGNGIVYSLDQNGAYGKIQSLGEYTLPDNELETSSERLMLYLREGWNSEFSVHRTKEFIQACEKRDILPDSGICETLSNSITFIQGKSKKIDCLYLFRQIHPQRHLNPKFLERLTSPNWYPSYQIYLQQITGALKKYEGLSSEEASYKANLAFEQLLITLIKKFLVQLNMMNPSSFSLKRIVEQIPYAKALNLKIVQKIKGNRNIFLLENLLQTSSPYHEDFMPVYEIITSSEIVLESEVFE
jgi:glycosyltransferase domain-containing protein